jgi:hypothetical protein
VDTVHHSLVLVTLLYGVHTTCECSGAVEHGHNGGLCTVLTCSWRVANFGSPTFGTAVADTLPGLGSVSVELERQRAANIPAIYVPAYGVGGFLHGANAEELAADFEQLITNSTLNYPTYAAFKSVTTSQIWRFPCALSSEPHSTRCAADTCV